MSQDPKVALVLVQLEEHWQKMVSFLLYKLSHEKSVFITAKDMEAFATDPRNILLVHGHSDSVEFRLVTREEGERLRAYQESQHGHA